MAETNIEGLINELGDNKLSQEEPMVNSILNDLNGDTNPAAPKITSQQQMPQITDEEKELLIKQQMAQQKIAQERMQQQQQQQMMQAQAQAERQQRMKMEQEKIVNESKGDVFKMILTEYKDVIIVLYFINLETISESMKFGLIILYDMEAGKYYFIYILRVI